MIWIDVHDKLPPKDTAILVWNRDYIDVAYYNGINTKTLNEDWDEVEFTHWMMLPEPPHD